MNTAISSLVAVISTLIVLGVAAWYFDQLLGQYSLLGWICLGWFGLLGVIKAAKK
jgi:hypothetical protein